MASVRAGQHTFGLGCHSFRWGEGKAVEGAQRELGFPMASNQILWIFPSGVVCAPFLFQITLDSAISGLPQVA
jgi:hypothetical protein